MVPVTQPPRTFISYSRLNADFALKLAQELRAAGVPIWLDQLDIPPGVRWDDELERALGECKIFMVILTPDSIASENVKDEIGYAIDTHKIIVPVLLENATLPLRLRRFQYVDFTSMSYDEGVKAAENMLRKLSDELVDAQETEYGVEEKDSFETEDLLTDEEEPVQGEAEGAFKSSAQEYTPEVESESPAEKQAVEQEEDDESFAQTESLLNEGKQFVQSGDLEQAISKFQEILALVPDHVEALTLLSTTQSQLLQSREESDRRARELEQKLAARRAEEQRMAWEQSQSATQVPVTPAMKPAPPSESKPPVAPKQQPQKSRAASPTPGKKGLPKGLLIGIGAAGILVISGICLVFGINYFANRGAAPGDETPQSVAQSAPVTAPTSTRAPTRLPTATDMPTQAPTPTKTSTQAPSPTRTPTQLPTDIPGPILLSISAAKQLEESGETQGVGATAREQWTSEEIINFYDNGEPVPVLNPDRIPILVGWGSTCATTSDILQDIVTNYEFTYYEFNGVVVPESNVVEIFYTSDDGWECHRSFFVIDHWESGEYPIYQEIYSTDVYNDGESDIEPYSSWGNWLVIVP